MRWQKCLQLRLAFNGIDCWAGRTWDGTKNCIFPKFFEVTTVASTCSEAYLIRTVNRLETVKLEVLPLKWQSCFWTFLSSSLFHLTRRCCCAFPLAVFHLKFLATPWGSVWLVVCRPSGFGVIDVLLPTPKNVPKKLAPNVCGPRKAASGEWSFLGFVLGGALMEMQSMAWVALFVLCFYISKQLELCQQVLDQGHYPLHAEHLQDNGPRLTRQTLKVSM